MFPKARIVHNAIGTGTARLDAPRVLQLIGNLCWKQPDLWRSRAADLHYLATRGCHGACIGTQLWRCDSSNIHHQLFEPMTRGADAESGVRGVGLGLFIVREIAKAHGGRVSVSSDEVSGTLFTVSFPFL